MVLALDFGPHNDKDHIHFIRLREAKKPLFLLEIRHKFFSITYFPFTYKRTNDGANFVDKNRSDDKKSLVLKLVDNRVVITFNNLSV